MAYAVRLDGINVCHPCNISNPATAQRIDLIGLTYAAPAVGGQRGLLTYRAINQTAQQLARGGWRRCSTGPVRQQVKGMLGG